MKGCLDDPDTKLTVSDAAKVSQFRGELGFVSELVREGHSRKCAQMTVFEDWPCSCGHDSPPREETSPDE